MKKIFGKWEFLINNCRNKIPAVLVMLAARIVLAYTGVRFALFTQGVIDSAASGNGEQFRNACLALLAVIIVTIVGYFVSQSINLKLHADIEVIMKGKLLHKLLDGQYSAVTQFRNGQLVYRMNNDIVVMYGGLIDIIPSIVSLITQFTISTTVLMQRAPKFTIFLVGGSAGILVVTFLIRKLIVRIQKEVSEIDGDIIGFMQEVLDKLLMIQALDVVEETERRADNVFRERKRLRYRAKNLNLTFNTGANILSYGIAFVSMCYFALQLYQGKISFGSLVAMTQLAALLETPLLSMPTLIRRLFHLTAAAERVKELVDIPSQDDGTSDVPVKPANLMHIEARNVSYSYSREKVLEDISFRIPSGGLTVITGSSGIGKSTLLKLMLGIYQREKGELVAVTASGDIPLTRKTRNLFTYVPQGNLLLSGTIKDNLLLTKPDATEEEISGALHISTLDEVLEKFPQGIDTEISESGRGISEGQGQRLSLARAILRDAPVLLLDEVTSSLDALTERKVLSRIRALPDKTCIVVTHRPAVLDMADLHLHISDQGVEVNPDRESWTQRWISSED